MGNEKFKSKTFSTVTPSEKFYNSTDTNSMRVVRVIKRNDFHCKWFLLRPFYENFTLVMEFF